MRACEAAMSPSGEEAQAEAVGRWGPCGQTQRQLRSSVSHGMRWGTGASRRLEVGQSCWIGRFHCV
jgi:hypothetical protein